MLLNLLKNAAEAIDGAQLPLLRRHIELRVVPRYTPDEGGVIEFSVSDKGPGLKEEVLNRLYEAFFSTKVEGMGIGLSLCRSIIESHRGRIRAQNLYNGTTVVGCMFLVHVARRNLAHGSRPPTRLPHVRGERRPGHECHCLLSSSPESARPSEGQNSIVQKHGALRE